ncbi:hypothetical protein [Nannocystis pusilla]|uniref:hypothetical protein n=1 Tax=Nannocystis pusilla TaxID=889268 RepID=UPI003B8274B0
MSEKPAMASAHGEAKKTRTGKSGRAEAARGEPGRRRRGRLPPRGPGPAGGPQFLGRDPAEALARAEAGAAEFKAGQFAQEWEGVAVLALFELNRKARQNGAQRRS